MAAARAGAEPAGDPDPYKVAAEPGDDEDDDDDIYDDLAGDDAAMIWTWMRQAEQAGLPDIGETPAGRQRGAGYSRA